MGESAIAAGVLHTLQDVICKFCNKKGHFINVCFLKAKSTTEPMKSGKGKDGGQRYDNRKPHGNHKAKNVVVETDADETNAAEVTDYFEFSGQVHFVDHVGQSFADGYDIGKWEETAFATKAMPKNTSSIVGNMAAFDLEFMKGNFDLFCIVTLMFVPIVIIMSFIVIIPYFFIVILMLLRSLSVRLSLLLSLILFYSS